ncbi:MAG: GntP family permease [Agriterribacter sp.]
MTTSFTQVMFFLTAGIGIIILLTTKYKIHAFFALFIACFVVGLGVGFPFDMVINIMKEGFGHIMQSLGFVIVLGTALGVILEYSGCTNVMASYILQKTGEKNAPLAMNITGFIVGLPIFCDSGYIVLSGLNQRIAARTKIAMPVMSGSLAVGLYAVHCLIPPHPGAAGAAGIIGVDIGRLIIMGIAIAIPASMAGYYWTKYAGRKFSFTNTTQYTPTEKEENKQPGVLHAFLPVIIPIILIAAGAFATMKGNEGWILKTLSVTGNPVIALFTGVLVAITTIPSFNKTDIAKLLQEGAEKAGGILVIIGGGGAFGAVLAATKIGDHLSEALPLGGLGIFFPFLLTALLKTAQGSSTVAIITAASIVQPLLHVLGLDNANGQLLCVLSMGAGSMMISHANDAYFWVISKFSGLEMKPMLRVYSMATLYMGLTALLLIYILSKAML